MYKFYIDNITFEKFLSQEIKSKAQNSKKIFENIMKTNINNKKKEYFKIPDMIYKPQIETKL